MKILHKDHKKNGKVETRKVCGPGMNLHLSNGISELLEPIAGEMVGRREMGSTENVLNVGDSYNNKVETAKAEKMCREILMNVVGNVENSEVSEETVEKKDDSSKKQEFQGKEGEEAVMALDAVGLYPSITKEVAAKACLEAARESEVRIDNMNLMEATRFLVLTMSEEKIEESGLRRILPKRRKRKDGKKTRKLGLTTANSLKPVTNEQSQWEWPRVSLTEAEKREVFARVVEGLVIIFCETQTYTWRNKFYLQILGLPIGHRATSAIARIVMNAMDKKVGEMLDGAGVDVDMWVRYIDDIRMILKMLA